VTVKTIAESKVMEKAGWALGSGGGIRRRVTNQRVSQGWGARTGSKRKRGSC